MVDFLAIGHSALVKQGVISNTSACVIAESQAAVIGVSCCQDVMEHMEKRVKSRFSHRKLLVNQLPSFEEVRGFALIVLLHVVRTGCVGQVKAAGCMEKGIK